MLASPSIQQIASALTYSSPRPNTRSPHRVLCLKLQMPLMRAEEKSPSPDRSWSAVVEAFLKFSPRVQFRAPHWVFIEIASTSHLFKGEEGLMLSAVSLAQDLGFGVQCAISDTPAGAQAFATSRPEHGELSDLRCQIIQAGEERDRLQDLPLPLLLHLEGLEPWTRSSTVENIITFFMMMGFKNAGDLTRFSITSFKERWGETGALLWKRLHAQDRQVISPLLPTEPLEDYVHLDFSISLTSLLLHQLQKSLHFLFARLQGRRLFAQRLVVTLHCEYSDQRHKIEIEPHTPNRDRDLFSALLENRLAEISLENPIQDFEVHVVPCLEKSHQFDFFEPRTSDRDKVLSLFSLLSQSTTRPGFFRIEPAILPEHGWSLSNDPDECDEEPEVFADYFSHQTEELPAITPTPVYGRSVMTAPRPTRLLSQPEPLSLFELQRLRILSSNPLERLESHWWESGSRRDYYFAVCPDGRCLWIFQDLQTQEYYLHGFFD